MDLKTLKAIAKELNIKGRSTMRKNELSQAIKEHQRTDLSRKEINTIAEKMNFKLSGRSIADRQSKLYTELNERLCRCIKKVKSQDKTESQAIAICRKTILQNRGVDVSHVNCKVPSGSLKKY